MFYIQECRDIVVSVNIENLEKPLKSIKVTPFYGNAFISYIFAINYSPLSRYTFIMNCIRLTGI